MKLDWIHTVLRTLAPIAFLLAAGCSHEADSQPTAAQHQVVRIAAGGEAVDYAAYYVAQEKGWFEEVLKPLGCSVEHTVIQTAAPINEALAAGRLDFVFVAEPPVIIGRAAGVDVRLIGISCSLRQSIIVRAGSGISDVAALRGKKVAVLSGSSSHYGLLKIAKDAGLGRKDLELVDMIPPDARVAFRTGQIDGWAVWPPFVEQELAAGDAELLPEGDAWIHSILAARGGFVDQAPQATERIIEVLDRAKAWLKANPKEAQAIVAARIKLDPAIIEMAWPRHDWTATFTPVVIDDIQRKADFLKDEGLIRGSVAAKDFVQPMGKSRP